jgi:hypothetical protein
MKTKIYIKKVSLKVRHLLGLTIKNVILIGLILTVIHLPVYAQVFQAKNHSWWYGAAIGANLNFYRGSIRELNSDLITAVAFNKGSGVGLYLTSHIAFHRPGSSWSIMLQAGYDSRKGSFDEKTVDCGCTDDLSTGLSYVTVEPSLRFAPFKSDFYLYSGPRLAFSLNKSFIYRQGINFDFLNQEAHLNTKMDFSNMNKIIISMQIGAGYDIPVSRQSNPTKFVLSPFISFQPYFGQSPRSIETWNITTFRFGVLLSLSPEYKYLTPIKDVKSVPML